MVISPSWDTALGDSILLAESTLYRIANNEDYGATIYPRREDTFRAFVECPFENVKVVIVGQDPYPGKGPRGEPFAHGMAFSTTCCNIPASLKNIFHELSKEYGLPPRKNPNLTDWAHQGVLLLSM